MSEKRPSALRRWLSSLVAGAAYGAVWAVGLMLLGRDPLPSIAIGCAGAIAWATLSIWIRGTLTRMRDRRLAMRDQEKDGGEGL